MIDLYLKPLKGFFVLPGCSFNNPKSVELLKYLIKSYYKKDITVLDFFAGSGTTGEAILELNLEDKGKRHFILCTNNEISDAKKLEYIQSNGYMTDISRTGKSIGSKIDKFFLENPDVEEKVMIDKRLDYEKCGICQSVTYPRLSTVITGIRPDGSKYSDGIKANLQYFQADMICDTSFDLEDALYEASCVLAELENMGSGYKVIDSDEKFDNLMKNIPDDLRMLYLTEDVLPDTTEEVFNRHNITVERIPQYYYE